MPGKMAGKAGKGFINMHEAMIWQLSDFNWPHSHFNLDTLRSFEGATLYEVTEH